MSEAGFVSPIAPPRHNGERAVYGTDASLAVRFFKKTIYLEGASAKTGKPEYQDQDFIEISMGAGKSTTERRVREEWEGETPPDSERFPRQWQAFKRETEQVPDGYPLEMCAWLPAAEAKGYKARNVHTVEQLAAIPDSAFDAFGMGVRKHRDQAAEYLKSMEGSADIMKLTAQIEELKQAMAAKDKAYEARLAELASKNRSKD